VPQQRHHHGETDEERQRPEQQERRDDQAPQRHGQRIGQHRADRGEHRDRRAHVAIQEQRKRDDTDDQHQHGEQEADAVADEDEHPAGRRREHLAEEIRNARRRRVAERRDIDRLRHAEPHEEDHHQEQAERRNGAKGGRAEYIERMRPIGFEFLLAAARELVEPERRKRADQRETGRQRKQQRQHVIADRDSPEDQASERIDQTEEHRVARHRRQVGVALAQSVQEIRGSYLADDRTRRTNAGAGEHV